MGGCYYLWGSVAKTKYGYNKSLPNHIYKKCTKVQKQILGFCAIPPKTEFQRINTKTGYKNLKRNVSDYT